MLMKGQLRGAVSMSGDYLIRSMVRSRNKGVEFAVRRQYGDRRCAGTRMVELRKDRPAPEASSGRKKRVCKDITGDLNCRTGIGAKDLSAGGHDAAGLRGDFEHLESNTIDKHANQDGGILGSNMHDKGI